MIGYKNKCTKKRALHIQGFKGQASDPDPGSVRISLILPCETESGFVDENALKCRTLFKKDKLSIKQR